jgi:gliding motility-associated lipoprotein GldD
VKLTRTILIASVLSLFVFQQCGNPAIPRPKGHFRIELPDESFKKSSVDCGLDLENPSYSFVENVKNEKSGNSCWFNLRFPHFKARLHCTQVEIDNNLVGLMNDAQDMVFSHEMKSNGISRIRISEDDINGVLYHLGGPVATPIQFFVTDSADHFLRGSLYFDHIPNADSTAPVVRRLLSDVEHLMRTVSWE